MRVAWLFAGLAVSALFNSATAQTNEVTAFEGAWSFEGSTPPDSWLGAGFRDGQGVCGGPKQLNIIIREEADPAGAQETRLRLHPDQPMGARVTSISAHRLTAEFLGEIEVFEIGDDARLTITRGDTRLAFSRC
ncbi:MAG TPA: hypothetical protein PLN53_01975 [Terricaulis sp.]|nr:hypothetical protein [Terricaulis sp.]